MAADAGSPAAAPAPRPARWSPGAALPLAVLLLGFPLFRSVTPLFAWTSGERLAVGLLEALFVAFALAGAGGRLPLGAAWTRAPVAGRLGGLAWLALGALAASATPWPQAAWLRQAEWLLHALFAVVLWAWLWAEPTRRDRLALALPLGFGVWIAWLAVFALRLPEPAAHDWVNEPPGFHNIRHADYYACAALLALAAQPGRRRAPIPVLLGLVLFWTVTIWTGSRGVLLAIAAGAVALAVVRLEGWGRRCLWLVGTAPLGAALSRLLRVDQGFLGLEYAIGRSVGGIASEGGAVEKLTETTAGRWQLWELAALEVRDHPWLGLGPDGFSFLPVDAVQPHALPLQAALEWGVPGALLFGAGLAGLAFAALRGVRREGVVGGGPRLVGLVVLLGLTAYAAVDGTWYSAFPISLAACAIALMLQPHGSPPPARGAWPGRAAAGVVAATGAVLALHAAVVLALASDPPPQPGDPAVRLVRAFPTRVESALHRGGVLYWALAWSERDPAAAVEALHWSHRYARRPWPHLQLEARLLWQQGRRSEALEHVAAAARVAALPAQLLRSRALERAMRGR